MTKITRQPSRKLARPAFKQPLTLNISVEELVGDTHGRTRQRGTGPAGKLKQAFETASKLPRRRQHKITELVEALVLQQTNSQNL